MVSYGSGDGNVGLGVIIAVVIGFIGLALSFPVYNAVDNSTQDKMRVIEVALEAEDKERFDYILKTQQGGFYTDTTLEAIEPVTTSNLKGEYLSINEVEEHYVSRVETYTDSEGETKTRIVWEWVEWSDDYYTSSKIKLHGNEYDTSSFSIPRHKYVKTQKIRSDIRVKYYVVDNNQKVAFFADAGENGMSNIYGGRYISLIPTDRNSLYENEMKSHESGVISFMFLYAMFVAIAMGAGFYVGYKQ